MSRQNYNHPPAETKAEIIDLLERIIAEIRDATERNKEEYENTIIELKTEITEMEDCTYREQYELIRQLFNDSDSKLIIELVKQANKKRI